MQQIIDNLKTLRNGLFKDEQAVIELIDETLKLVEQTHQTDWLFVLPKITGKEFNVVCYATHDPNDAELYTHWAKDLTMLISKNGQSIKLNSEEIQELVKCLPKTVGGKY